MFHDGSANHSFFAVGQMITPATPRGRCSPTVGVSELYPAPPGSKGGVYVGGVVR